MSKPTKMKKNYLTGLILSLAAFLLLTIPTMARDWQWEMVAGVSFNLDNSMITSVQISPSTTNPSNHQIKVYVEKDQDNKALFPRGKTSLRIDFQGSEFLPGRIIDQNGNPGDYDSFYATPISSDGSKTGSDVSYFHFPNLAYNGTKRIIAFYFTDEFGMNFGPFEYQAPEDAITQTQPPITIDPNPIPTDSSTDSSTIQIASLKPHLLVEQYSFSKNVTAGQDFTLHFTLKNYSERRTVENVVVTITPSEGVFLKTSTNTFYYSSIGIGKTATISVTCKMALNVPLDVQNINIDTAFQYFDKKEEDPVEGGDKILIPVPTGKINRAKLTSITIPKDFKQDKEGNVEYGFINNGFSTVYNAEVFVYDESGAELAWQFVGNVEAGKQAAVKAIPLKFKTGGLKNLRLVVAYEDEQLTPNQLEKAFVLDVISTETSSEMIDPGFPGGMDPGMDPGMEPTPPPAGGLSPLLIVLIVLALLAVALVVFLRIRKHRSQNFDDFYQAFPEEKEKQFSKTDSAIETSEPPALGAADENHTEGPKAEGQ